MKILNREFMQGVWQITRGYWVSAERWQARLLLAVIVSLNLGHVYILVLLNEWNNGFYNALQNYDKDGFVSALGTFTLLATCYIIVAVYEIYMQQMLEIKWRTWLTAEYMQKWLGQRVYYKMQILDNKTDNPDQRISEDLRLFVSLSLQLSLGLLKAGVTLCSFIAILWRLSGELTVPLGGGSVIIPGYMVWVAIAYAFIGTWLTTKIGNPLVGLNFQQQRFEADFRFNLVRLRENSESIALYNGEKQEQQGLRENFLRVVGNFRQLMLRQKKLTWFTSGYSQISIIFPLLVAAPRYFSKEISLGGLLQTSSAFGRVETALSFFITSYSTLAEWQATVGRLLGFTESMHKAEELSRDAEIAVEYRVQPQVAVQALDIKLPDGADLLQQLDLTLMPGDSLLIMGASGCGKSTLLRTLAGIWPFGRGSIGWPQQPKVLFLPQKSYLPLGTLREVLLYPYAASCTDGEIRQILQLCQLPQLCSRLDDKESWSHILSMGEQQKIAFARAILQQPQWLFLDEATSAVDEEAEAQLYQLLRRELPEAAIVSVGHRSTLGSYHQRRLLLDKKGHWCLQ